MSTSTEDCVGGDKKKIQDLVKKLRGLLVKFKKLEEKHRVSEKERKCAKEAETTCREEFAEQEKRNGELNEKYHLLAKKMKASIGLIQSLRTEKKNLEDKYTVLKDKAAKHLAEMEKQRDSVSKQRAEVEDEMHCFQRERNKALESSVQESKQEEALRRETLRMNEILQARVSDLQTSLTKAERDLRESRRRRNTNSERERSSHFHEQTIMVLRHENEIALKRAKASYASEIRLETRDMRQALHRLETENQELEKTRHESARRLEMKDSESHDCMKREIRETREKLREAQEEETRLRRELNNQNRSNSVDESLSSRVIELKTELAEERMRQGSLSRELTKSRDAFRKQNVRMEMLREECESAKMAVELGKSQIAMLSKKLSSCGSVPSTSSILSQFWS